MEVEFLPGNPFQRRTIQSDRLSFENRADKKPEMNGFPRIVVRYGFKTLSHAHLDSQFLPQLAFEALLESLASLAFATREFPQTAKVRLCVALSNQELAIAEDDAG